MTNRKMISKPTKEYHPQSKSKKSVKECEKGGWRSSRCILHFQRRPANLRSMRIFPGGKSLSRQPVLNLPAGHLPPWAAPLHHTIDAGYLFICRAQWDFKELPHMFFNVKLNFKLGLFSSTFWFARRTHPWAARLFSSGKSSYCIKNFHWIIE